MATFRQIHIKIWKDGWFLDLPSDHKLLFIYLFSNERANLFGLYDLPVKVICFETDLDVETVNAGLEEFASKGKAFYEDGWIWVRSLLAYNAQNLKSPKTQAHLKKTLDEIPDIPLRDRALAYYKQKLGYTYPSHTPSIPILQEQEQDQNQQAGTDQHQPQQVPAGAGEIISELTDLQIHSSTANELVGMYKAAGKMDLLVAHAGGWIAHYKEQPGIDDPIALAVPQLRAALAPPPPPAVAAVRCLPCVAVYV